MKDGSYPSPGSYMVNALLRTMLSTQACLESRGNPDQCDGSALQALWERLQCQLCDLGHKEEIESALLNYQAALWRSLLYSLWPRIC